VHAESARRVAGTLGVERGSGLPDSAPFDRRRSERQRFGSPPLAHVRVMHHL